jgi:hypothetical protein
MRTAQGSVRRKGKNMACTWGTSTDELPDDHKETYGEAEDPAYAYARAEASFWRFSKGLHTIMSDEDLILARPDMAEAVDRMLAKVCVVP